jgi:hypothetical protein
MYGMQNILKYTANMATIHLRLWNGYESAEPSIRCDKSRNTGFVTGLHPAS